MRRSGAFFCSFSACQRQSSLGLTAVLSMGLGVISPRGTPRRQCEPGIRRSRRIRRCVPSRGGRDRGIVRADIRIGIRLGQRVCLRSLNRRTTLLGRGTRAVTRRWVRLGRLAPIILIRQRDRLLVARGAHAVHVLTGNDYMGLGGQAMITIIVASIDSEGSWRTGNDHDYRCFNWEYPGALGCSLLLTHLARWSKCRPLGGRNFGEFLRNVG